MDVKEIECLMDCIIEEEIIEVVIVFMQFYCENVKYLDCFYKWVVKVGLDWVKEQIVEDIENCKVLVECFEFLQLIYQKDFWVELV